MGKPKKRKGKIRVRTGAKVRKKSEQRKDIIPRMKAQMPRSNGVVFKVKIKHK